MNIRLLKSENELMGEAVLFGKTEFGRERYEYRLMRSIKGGREAYSLEASRFRGGLLVSRETVFDISSSYEFSFSVFRKVVIGIAFPETLHDVVYDLLP